MGLIITLDEARAYDYRTDDPMNVDLRFNSKAHFPEGLQDRIRRVASLEDKPDTIQGQRSSLVKLNDPWQVKHGFEVQGVQVKGHFFRPSEESLTITPPQMRMYLGRGHPPTLWRFNQQGTLHFEPSADIPSGCMLYENAAIGVGTSEEKVNMVDLTREIPMIAALADLYL